MRLAIGQVYAGAWREHLPRRYMTSLLATLREIWMGRTVVTDLALIESGEFPISEARNEICEKALEWGCERLLFLDCDHEFEPSSVTKLLNSPHDVVTGRYHVKQPPYHPNLYVVPKDEHRVGEYKTVHYGQGVFPVDRCGAGALLVSGAALEDIGDPWFKYGMNPRPPYRMTVSEDFWFCQRAQEAGYPIMADWDATFGHLLTGAVDEHWRDEYLKPLEAEIQNGKTDLLDSIVVLGFPDGRDVGGHRVQNYGPDLAATMSRILSNLPSSCPS